MYIQIIVDCLNVCCYRILGEGRNLCCKPCGLYPIANWIMQYNVFILTNSLLFISDTCVHKRSGLAQWLASRTMDQGVPGSRPGRGTVCCGLEQVTFTHCLVLVMDGRLGLTVTRLETTLCLTC